MIGKYWTVECPHCHIEVEISDWKPGIEIVCIHCRTKYMLLNPGEESPLDIERRQKKALKRLKAKRDRREAWNRIFEGIVSTAKPLGFAVLIIATLYLGFSEPPTDLLHYVGIASIISVVAWKFYRRRPRTSSEVNRITLSAIAVIVVCLAVRGYFDTTTERHTTRDSNGESTEYENVISRFGRKYIYRTIRVFDQDGSFVCVMEGPLSPESGKSHGHWKYLGFSPIHGEDWWYWYGDQVSEGEWHVRNNGRQ